MTLALKIKKLKIILILRNDFFRNNHSIATVHTVHFPLLHITTLQHILFSTNRCAQIASTVASQSEVADSNDDNEILLAEEISEHTPLEKELHLS